MTDDPNLIRFAHRTEAGRQLAIALESLPRDGGVVLALPRGGVPVAYPIATHLGLPLDVFLVRKLGAPENPELAVGAMASGGTVVWNPEILRKLRLTDSLTAPLLEAARRDIEQQGKQYREARVRLEVKDRRVFLVDDGIATGATMRAAVLALREQEVREVFLATPVASREAVNSLTPLCDRLVCLHQPDPFVAVGNWYEDFSPISTEEVTQLLKRSQTP